MAGKMTTCLVVVWEAERNSFAALGSAKDLGNDYSGNKNATGDRCPAIFFLLCSKET